MKRFFRWKALLAGTLASTLLFGEIDLFSNRVFAQEVSEEFTEAPSVFEEDTTEVQESSFAVEADPTMETLEEEESISAEDVLEQEQNQNTNEEVTLEEETQQNAALEEAKQAFDKILEDHDVIALINNTDNYGVKESPDKDSRIIETLSSGYSVTMTGVEITENKVWYYVSFAVNDNVYYGYVENENLTSSDLDFREWKETFEIDKISGGRSSLSRTTGTNLNAFPESYRPYIQSLMNKHPNWTFVPFQTGLDWNTVISNEMYPTRNLVPMSSNASWKSTDPQFYDASTGKWIPQDSGNWAQASEGIVKYYMDPRNFLNEDSVFQFELLTYSTEHIESGVEAILKGTFMSNKVLEDNSASGKTYAKVFMELGKELKVSPYFLASRIRQEQGVSGSKLISGTYPGYEGYYNYFNMGATGNTLTEVIVNGLKEAKKEGWTTRYLSLKGGAAKVASKYIKRGQDTLYLQKFDVDSSYDGLYWHQYMQNLLAADSEGKSVKRAYESIGVIDSSFVFKIPVYNNMPASAVSKPADTLVQPSVKLQSNNLSSVTLSWNSISEAAGYRIYRSESENGSYSLVNTVTNALTYTDTTTPGTTYYYKIEAYNGAVKSPFSNVVAVSTKPSPTTIKSIKLRSYIYADLSWTEVSGVSGYRIYRKTGANGTYKGIKTIKGSSTVAYTDSTVLPNETYYYRIRAYRTIHGVNYYSNYTKAQLFSTAMKGATLSQVKADGNSAVLTWKKAFGVTGYRIYRRTSAGSFKGIKNVRGSNTLSYVDKGVSPKQTYYYRIRAFRNAGGKNYYSPYSKQIKVTIK